MSACRRVDRYDSSRLAGGRLRNVPEGRCERSLARSAWDSPPQKSRPVGYDVVREGVHTDSMIGVTRFRIRKPKTFMFSREAFPGTSCHCSLDISRTIYASRANQDGLLTEEGKAGRLTYCKQPVPACTLGLRPRHFVPGYDRCCPSRDALAEISQQARCHTLKVG